MLAERKSRVKWTLNPRGNLWSQDSNKFGQKMLEKMGWKAGKGLGANEQGITEHIKVSYKSDNKCIGYKEHGDEWVQQQSQFEDFLSELNASHKKETSIEDEQGNNSLEQRSRQSKARVHYHKFTRGKDLSNYSKHDLACIIGVKKPKAEIDGRINDSKEEPRVGGVDNSFGVTTIHSGSMSDYFNKKNKSNCQTEASDEPSSYGIEVERLDKLKKEENLDMTYDAECELDEDQQISEEPYNEPVDVVKKKNNKDKVKLNTNYVDGNKLANDKSQFYNDDKNIYNSELMYLDNEEENFKTKKRKYVSEDVVRFENSENGSNNEAMMDKKKRKKKKYCNNDEDINKSDKSISRNSSKEVLETENDYSGEKKKHKDSNPEESKDSEESDKSNKKLENITDEDFKGFSVDSLKKKKKKSNNIKEFVEGDSKENEKISSNDLVAVSEEVAVETERRKKKKKSGKNTDEFVEGVCRQDETVVSNDITALSEEENISNFPVQKKKLKKNSSNSVFSTNEKSNPQASVDSEEQCLEKFENENGKEVTVESKKRKNKKSHINNEIVEEISNKQDESIVHNDVIHTTKLEIEAVEVYTEKKKRKKKSNNLNNIPIQHELHEKNDTDENALVVEDNQEENISCRTSIENNKKNKKKKEKKTDKDMEEKEISNESHKREGSPLKHVGSIEESVKNNENDESNLITKRIKRKSRDISEEQNLEYNKNLDCNTDMEIQNKKKKRKSHDNNGELIVPPDESLLINVTDVIEPQTEKKKRKKKVDSCEVMKTEEVISQESNDDDDFLNKSSKKSLTRTETDNRCSEEVSADTKTSKKKAVLCSIID
ncbi:hypothetical protein C0J52_01500 [Blattella germanica]|nr:hypothetical protein C0J52_01500 [Blattella germanica]